MVGIVILCLYCLAIPKFSTASHYTVRCGDFEARAAGFSCGDVLEATIDCPLVGVVGGDREGNAAATGAVGLGIAELEAAAHQVFGVIDREALELFGAGGIDDDRQLFEGEVVIRGLDLAGELQIVGTARTAIGDHGEAKMRTVRLAGTHPFNFIDRGIGNLDHGRGVGGRESIPIMPKRGAIA